MNKDFFRDSAQKIAQRSSTAVFATNDEEKAILYSLAKKGPSILTDLSNATSLFGLWHTTRWAIKRRLRGTRDCLGLVEYEYLAERDHDDRIRGKNGKLYCLTTKGVLASLASGISLDKNWLFKKYVEFIKAILSRPIQFFGERQGIGPKLDEKTKNFLVKTISNYIKYQIYTFLIWHEANEISLRKKLDTDWYFHSFFQSHSEYINWEFPKIIEKKRIAEYKEILRKNFVYSKILHGIGYEHDRNNFKKGGHIDSIVQNFTMTIPYVFRWYEYFDKFQMNYPIDKPYGVKPIIGFSYVEPQSGIDIEYEGTFGHKKMIKLNIKNMVKEVLEEDLEIPNFPINEIWKSRNDVSKITAADFP